jgi:hypothetical protein
MADEVLSEDALLGAYCRHLIRFNRMLVAVLATLLLVIVVVASAGARRLASSDILVAKELRIVDDKGKVRAILGVATSSSDDAKLVRLSLRDESGSDRLELIASAGGHNAISFRDGKNVTRLWIASLHDGRSGLVVADDQGRECVGVGTFGNKPGFEAAGFSGENVVRVNLAAKADGGSGLWITRTAAKSYLREIRTPNPVVAAESLLTLATSPKGGTGLEIWDNERHRRVELQVDAESHSGLKLYDPRELPGVLMDVAPNGACHLNFMENVPGRLRETPHKAQSKTDAASSQALEASKSTPFTRAGT